MTASRGGAAGAAPVERFKPTNGILPGWVGLIAVAVGVGYVVLEARTTTGLQVALGLVLAGMVVWVTQLRSRAAAYPQTLLLKNSLIDTSIPLRLIEEVSVRRTLNIWVGDRRYVCIGIGRSLSSMLKSKRTQSLGFSRLEEYAESADRPRRDQSAMAYETFVVTRIQELADQAKKSSPPVPPLEVRHHLAWPEVIALTATGVAFVITLLL